MGGYLAIETELQRLRAQAQSVKGKDTPFRVEFRYPGGTKHWQYFTTVDDADQAEDSSCTYGLTGRAYIAKPSSQQIQQRGPRGGWTKFTPCSLCGKRPRSGECPVLIDEKNEIVCEQCYAEVD
jgi:hypothetical protein